MRRPSLLASPLLATAALALLMAPSPGRAVGVPYQFDLTVSGGTSGAFGGVGFAETFTATVTFDPEVAWPRNGSDFLLDLNGTVFDHALPTDSILLGANALGSLTPDDPNGFRDYIVRINYQGDGTTVTTLGVPALVIGALGDDDETWRATDAAGRSLSGSFSVSSVPEPSSIVLVAVGSGGLALLGRRRRPRRDSARPGEATP